MMVMNGSASQGLIAHEVGRICAHGILANNEWRDPWLDEGLVSFITNWFGEEMEGMSGVWENNLARIARFEDEASPQAVATPSSDFLDPQSYGTYSYVKGSVFFYMPSELMGWDDFRRVLQLYYGLRSVVTHQREDRRWVTELTVDRTGGIWMPVQGGESGG